jgi:hypothetical protein
MRTQIIVLMITCLFTINCQYWQTCGVAATAPTTTASCTASSNTTSNCCFVSIGSTKGCYSFPKNATYDTLQGNFSSNQTGDYYVDCGSTATSGASFFGTPYCGNAAFKTNASLLNCTAQGTVTTPCCYVEAKFGSGPFNANAVGACLTANSAFGQGALAKTLYANTSSVNMWCGNGTGVTAYPNIVTSSSFLSTNFVALLLAMLYIAF